MRAEPSAPLAPADSKARAATYPDATREVDVEGEKLVRSEGAFRASLGADLDGDGARDALLLSTDAQGRPVLETALRSGAGLTLGSAALQLVTDAARCSLQKATISSFGDESALIEMECACVPATQTGAAAGPGQNAKNAALGSQKPTPPAPNPDSAEQAALAQVHSLVVSLEAAPRVLLHLATAAPAGTGSTQALAIQLQSEDRDADEHADVRADLDLVSSQASAPWHLTLAWLNRPSGLARESTEPEQTLATQASEALRMLGQKPAAALQLAEEALLLHRLLCHESGAAELIVDGQAGLWCGASAAAGKAAYVRVAALAKLQQLFPALDAFAALDAPGYKVEVALRKKAKRAVAEIRGDTHFIWRIGPVLHPPDAPSLRLPALGFLDEEHLLLRGAIAQSYEPSTGQLVPAGLSPSVLLVDAQARLALTELTRKCDGHHLQVVPAAQIVAGVVAGASVAEPRIEPEVARDFVRCASGAAKEQSEPGWSVLGMSAQGAVVAHAASVYLVPISAGEAANVASRELPSSENAPALLSPAALSGDGRRYALATSEGVAVIDRWPTPIVTLVRTPASCPDAISDVALSPSGRHLAMVCGGHVYVAESGSQAPSGEPVTPATPLAIPAPNAPPPAVQAAPPEPEHPAAPVPSNAPPQPH